MRKRLFGRKAFVALTALTALAGCNKSDDAQKQAQAAAQAGRPQVSVMTLQPQSVTITAELPGRVTASLESEVRPQVAGILLKRLFEEGGEVSAGQPLYQIDPTVYQASYDSAVATLKKSEAAVPSAQAKVDRYQGLIKQNAISKQDLDDALATLAQAQADVAASKAALATAKINLDYTTVRAPISGRTDKSALTPGALVTASQTTLLTTVRTLDPVNVDVTQSSANLLDLKQAIDAGRIKISGADVNVKLKLENGTIYPLSGRLEFSEANVSTSTGTYNVRATFPNPQRLLLPGMYVRAIVEEGIAPNSFLAPQRAVTRNTRGDAVAEFLDADDRVVERQLTLGKNVGNYWLVTEGVSAGDRIIIEGAQFARVGQLATGVEATIDDASGEVLARGTLAPAQPKAAPAQSKDAPAHDQAPQQKAAP